MAGQAKARLVGLAESIRWTETTHQHNAHQPHAHQIHDTQTLDSHTHHNDRTDLENRHSQTLHSHIHQNYRTDHEHFDSYEQRASRQNRHSKKFQSELCKSFFQPFQSKSQRNFHSKSITKDQLSSCMSSKFSHMYSKFQSLLKGTYRPSRQTRPIQPQSEGESRNKRKG